MYIHRQGSQGTARTAPLPVNHSPTAQRKQVHAINAGSVHVPTLGQVLSSQLVVPRTMHKQVRCKRGKKRGAIAIKHCFSRKRQLCTVRHYCVQCVQ